MTDCKSRFYIYAIFISWVVVFFAILAVFYNYMETGILYESPPPQKSHRFKWMDMMETETKIEGITDVKEKVAQAVKK